jgi:hypothetical protein
MNGAGGALNRLKDRQYLSGMGGVGLTLVMAATAEGTYFVHDGLLENGGRARLFQ